MPLEIIGTLRVFVGMASYCGGAMSGDACVQIFLYQTVTIGESMLSLYSHRVFALLRILDSYIKAILRSLRHLNSRKVMQCRCKAWHAQGWKIGFWWGGYVIIWWCAGLTVVAGVEPAWDREGFWCYEWNLLLGAAQRETVFCRCD